jgi:hypothetical protein
MNKKELKSLIESKVKEGKDAQQIFDEVVVESTLSPRDIAEAVSLVPTQQTRKKHRVAQTILVSILTLVVLMGFLNALILAIQEGFPMFPLVFFFPILTVIFLVGILNYKLSYYRWIAILSLFGVLRNFRELIDETTFVESLIDLILRICHHRFGLLPARCHEKQI